MSREFTINGSLAYEDSEGTELSLQVVDLIASITTKSYSQFKKNIGTAEEALPLAEVANPGWCVLINRDETNFVNIRVSTGGAIFAKLKPGEFCLLRLGSGAAVPYAIADTDECQVEGLIFDT